MRPHFRGRPEYPSKPDPIRAASHEKPQSHALTWRISIRLRISAVLGGEAGIDSSCYVLCLNPGLYLKIESDRIRSCPRAI